MKGLRRAWPRTMTRQLGVLLLLALLASNLIAMLLLQRTGSLVHPLSRTLVVERLATAYQAARDLPSADANRLLDAMATADTRFWVASTAQVQPFAMHTE